MINRQKHRGTCGITSIANAYQWCGGDMSYKSAIDYCKNNNIRINGMWPYEMAKILENLSIDHEVVFNLTQTKIYNIIKEGNALIFLYTWKTKKKQGAHYVFIDEMDKNKVRAWNNSKKNKTPWISRNKLGRYIKRTAHYKPHLYAVGFVIKGAK